METKQEADIRLELTTIGLDKEFVDFLNSSEVQSFAKALTNRSSYISASSLNAALSVFSNEARTAIIFMLETKFGVRTNGQSPSTIYELQKALERMFGSASSIIMERVEAAMMQTDNSN
jgi:hypothetical protein